MVVLAKCNNPVIHFVNFITKPNNMRKLYFFAICIFMVVNLSKSNAQYHISGLQYHTMHFWQQLYAINPAAREPGQKRVLCVSAATNNFKVTNSTLYNSYVTYQHPFKNHLIGLLFNKISDFQPNITEAALGYSYHFDLSTNSTLTIGTQVSVKKFFIQREWSIGQNFIKFNRTVSPNINTGLQYARNNFFIGFSAKGIMQTMTTSSYILYSDKKIYTRKYIIMPSYFLTSGYIFLRGKPIEIKSTLLYGADKLSSLIHLNNTVYYKKKVSLGASLLLSDFSGININAGIVIKEKAEISLAIRPSRDELFDKKYEDTPPGLELMAKIKF